MKPLFEKGGMEMDIYLTGLRSKSFRFAHIMEKWIQKNILERIEKF